ncbi:MAG: class B sortase, partial [Lachnospiraceae bacterium]|nr:class B sortase [Lachnospiraceae bacterium]
YFYSARTSMDYSQLAALKGSDALSETNQTSNNFSIHKTSVILPDVLDEYKTLYEKNKRLIGWLEIDDTIINYPVMQTSNNEYYLDHNFNQEYDKNGSLFLDCDCSIYPASTNLIIYGHHMKSGQMFGQLQKYAKESYGKEHSLIQFDSIYEKATYQVMYVFRSQVYSEDDLVFKYYQFINANSEEEFNSYNKEMEAMSLYDTGVVASYGDSLLTLSTCDHSQADGRFVVVAKRIK